MLTVDSWERVPGLRHGFLDARDCAAAPDWAGVVAAPILVPRQVHGVAVVAAPAEGGERPEADAATTIPGAGLVGILTADCVPVLFLDRQERAAAAAHAGWRGAAAGVLEETIASLRNAYGIGAQDLETAIGPAIGPCCYAVGNEVRAAFQARTGATTSDAWTERDARLYLDLRLAVARTLTAAGVAASTIVGGCVRCDPRFHSFRRDAAAAGRQLSFIGWA